MKDIVKDSEATMSVKNTNAFRAFMMSMVVFGLPLAALVLAVVLTLAQHADSRSPYFYVGIALMLIGWCLLLYSKWDQIRKGQLLKFGVSNPKMRLLYGLSYATMLAGYLLSTFSGTL